MTRSGLFILAAVSLAIALSSPFDSEAQRVQRIAAIVNEDVISEYDLRARMQVVIVSSNLRPTAKLRQRLGQQVLRNLIDERLQAQEAKRKNISVTKRNMRTAIARLEKRNKLSPGSFNNFLRVKIIE